MGYPFRRTEIIRCLLSLLVMTTSVGAPLRTHTSVRVLLFASHYGLARSTVGRVRAVSDGSISRGFRAVVVVASGGSEATAGHEEPRNPRTYPSSSASAAPLSNDPRGTTPLNPPLRC